jgi:anti-anti-sigma regulatory factor
MPSTVEFELPERLSVVAENALLPFLRQNPDAPLAISARRLRRIDTPLVQLLLAAAADHRARGVPFRLTGLSPDQAAQLALLGVTPALLETEVQP